MTVKTIRLFGSILIYTIISLSLSGSLIYGQDTNDISGKISDRGEELEDLRTTIKDLKREISKKKSAEVNVIKQINSLNKQLDFTNRFLGRLGREIKFRDGEVAESRKIVKASKDHLVVLKKRFSKRAVTMYKAGTYSDYELLLTSASISQFFYRLKYLKIINNNDRKLHASITTAITDLNKQEKRLLREIADREKMTGEQVTERKNLSKTKKDRRTLLRKVRNDQGALRQQVKDKETAAKQVDAIITALVEERKRLEELARQRKVSIEELEIDADFAGHRGNLIWPVVGKVTSKFGKRRHAVLKTITENTGIDIKADEGSEIVSVLTGRVTSITWIRGFGNTMILDHGAGYYSVYTHLGEIDVVPGEVVSSGQRIATVGDSGSFEGSGLHFEIWHNREKQDPIKWLKKAL